MPHTNLIRKTRFLLGIGSTRANKICADSGVNRNKKVHELDDNDLEILRNHVEKYQLEGDLRRETSINIKRLMDIGSYRGIRHRKGLPLRGQKTKNNSRTRKGPRKLIKAK